MYTRFHTWLDTLSDGWRLFVGLMCNLPLIVGASLLNFIHPLALWQIVLAGFLMTLTTVVALSNVFWIV